MMQLAQGLRCTGRQAVQHANALRTAAALVIALSAARCSLPPGAISDGGPDPSRADGRAADGSPEARLHLEVKPGCNPLATTTECLLPWPSDFLTVDDATTPTGRRLAIPDGVVAGIPTAKPFDLAPFNRADGAPTTAPILVHFGVNVAADYLAGYDAPAASLDPKSPIALFDLTTGQREPFLSEMDRNHAGQAGRHALIIRPIRPLEFGRRYAVAIRATARDEASRPLPASPGFVALRDKLATDNAAIEAARGRYETLFGFLASRGYARSELHLAWDYTTASRERVIGPVLAMRQRVFAAAAAAPFGISYTVDKVTDNPNANLARIVEGTFSPPTYLRSDNTLDLRADGSPVEQAARSYPFTMLIPKRAVAEPLPLVLFGHGIFGSGREYLTDAKLPIQALAESAGGVVIATDWIGLSNGDLDLVIKEVIPDLNRLGLVCDRLVQSLANNLALLELARGPLQSDSRVAVGKQPLLAAATYYYGVSLGGIQGSSLIPLSRHITRAVLAVPGASWANLLARSHVYQPIKPFADALYPDPLGQQILINLFQIRFDRSDPANLARLMLHDRLPGAPSELRVIVQESMGDCLVPNLTTDMLARSIGLSQLTPAVAPVHGLAPLTSPTTSSVLAQYALLDHLAKYTPPAENLVPQQDNNVHSDMVFLPNVLAQVVDLFKTGTVIQHCEAACTPN